MKDDVLKRVFFSRADCSNVDKADGKPEHNGLSSFGKVSLPKKYSLISTINSCFFAWTDCDKRTESAGHDNRPVT